MSQEQRVDAFSKNCFVECWFIVRHVLNLSPPVVRIAILGKDLEQYSYSLVSPIFLLSVAANPPLNLLPVPTGLGGSLTQHG